MNQVGDILECYTVSGQLVGVWECVEPMIMPDDPHGKWVWHEALDTERKTS